VSRLFAGVIDECDGEEGANRKPDPNPNHERDPIVDTRTVSALHIFRELRRVLLQMHDGIPTKIGWD